jgi:hypothetical protein
MHISLTILTIRTSHLPHHTRATGPNGLDSPPLGGEPCGQIDTARACQSRHPVTEPTYVPAHGLPAAAATLSTSGYLSGILDSAGRDRGDLATAAAFNLARLAMQERDVPGAPEWNRRARATARLETAAGLTCLVEIQAARLAIARGRLGEARSLLERARLHAADTGWPDSAAEASTVLGLVAYLDGSRQVGVELALERADAMNRGRTSRDDLCRQYIEDWNRFDEAMAEVRRSYVMGVTVAAEITLHVRSGELRQDVEAAVFHDWRDNRLVRYRAYLDVAPQLAAGYSAYRERQDRRYRFTRNGHDTARLDFDACGGGTRWRLGRKVGRSLSQRDRRYSAFKRQDGRRSLPTRRLSIRRLPSARMWSACWLRPRWHLRQACRVMSTTSRQGW